MVFSLPLSLTSFREPREFAHLPLTLELVPYLDLKNTDLGVLKPTTTKKWALFSPMGPRQLEVAQPLLTPCCRMEHGLYLLSILEEGTVGWVHYRHSLDLGGKALSAPPSPAEFRTLASP